MSRKTKHTPPPWQAGVGRIVGIPEDMFGVFTPGQKGRNGHPRIVAVTGRVSDAEYQNESIADAFFIAAAPEMYDMLEEIARGPYEDSDCRSLCEAHAARARALLDKTRGVHEAAE